jgi:hypothetical protein
MTQQEEAFATTDRIVPPRPAGPKPYSSHTESWGLS